MPATTTKTASRTSGPTVVGKGCTEYEFNFSDSQNPTHEAVGGEKPDEDTKLIARSTQARIQAWYTQPGMTFPKALLLSVPAVSCTYW
jgi:hypothetical protein